MATTAVEAATIFVSKLSNATSSIGKILVPSLALVATAFFSQTMAFSSQQQQLPGSAALPPSTAAASSPSVLSARSSKRFEIPSHAQNIHLIVLVHGWLGSPAEMASIQEALDSEIEKHNSSPSCEKELDDSSSASTTSSLPEEGEKNIIAKNPSSAPTSFCKPLGTDSQTWFVVHSAECNEGNTSDGVHEGGKRLGNEVNDLIKDLVPSESEEDETTSKRRIYLSFIGNSLGGLYARSALSKIHWALPNGNKVIPCIFCTTATPHLGKRGQTYVRIPRFAEHGIGMALRPTGQDLFGLNTVIEGLATEKEYVEPLGRFSKRIAYANAFGTDLQVPTATAAFLADTESKHYTQENKPPFLLTVTTPHDPELLASISKATTSSDEDSPSSTAGSTQGAHVPASTMARTLDALGWTKVFCDVRDLLVSVPIPFKEESSSEFKAKDEWTSHELKSAVASRIIHDKKWPIPFGHTMLIANAKSELYAKLNQGGKPFVQQLAADLLEDILKCQTTSEDSNEH